jgi:tetratricopeptide (TPR) repeat protein
MQVNLAAMFRPVAGVLFLLSAGFAQTSAPEGIRLDVEGKGAEARVLFQRAIDAATAPFAKAQAQRDMAMSWAFEGSCLKTLEYEQLVIDYWVTQERSQPGNAFYQEGEMANEGARVCIDYGDLDSAARWYQKGHDLGLREPGISADRRALWGYRLEHAMARIAARRGNRAEALRHVEAARASLEQMKESRAQQQAFFPYLTGYVALYLGDYQAALSDLQNAQNDPFIQCLIGQAYEKLGDMSKAKEFFRLAAAGAGHNPPAAYGIPFAKKKLGLL